MAYSTQGGQLRDYYDAVIIEATTRDSVEHTGLPDSYTIILKVRTTTGEEGRVFLAVDELAGRSEATKGYTHWQLALQAIRKVDPDAKVDDLANPGVLIGKTCRVLRVESEDGKIKWFLAMRDRPLEAGGQSGVNQPFDAAKRLAAITARYNSRTGSAATPAATPAKAPATAWKGPQAPRRPDMDWSKVSSEGF